MKINCIFFIYFGFLRKYLSATSKINWFESSYAANWSRPVWIFDRVETRWERWNAGLYRKRKSHFASDQKTRSLSEYPAHACQIWLRENDCGSPNECMRQTLHWVCMCVCALLLNYQKESLLLYVYRVYLLLFAGSISIIY